MARLITSPIDPTKPVCLLRFDDGFASDYTQVYPILREYGIPATFVMITGNYDGGQTGYPSAANQVTAAQLQEMVASGYAEVALHCRHHSKLFCIGSGGYADYASMLSDVQAAMDTMHTLFDDYQPIIDHVGFASSTCDADGAKACWEAGLRWGSGMTPISATAIGGRHLAYFCEHRMPLQLLDAFRFPGTGAPDEGVLPAEGTLAQWQATSAWICFYWHRILASGSALDSNDRTDGYLRAWIEQCLSVGVQFVSLSQLRQLLYTEAWQPRHIVGGKNLARNGQLRYSHLTYPSGSTMRPAQTWARGGGTVNGHFALTGGPTSRDDGAECGLLRCETTSGVWWSHNTNISGPGVYSLKCKIKSGTEATKKIGILAVEAKGGNGVGEIGNEAKTTLASNIYFTPTSDWVEHEYKFRVSGPGYRRLRFVFCAESGATGYHLLSDVGVYKLGDLGPNEAALLA